MCQWVFAWNTEIACVLFYLSGIQWEFPLQPTAGSGMSCDSPLKSPRTSSPPCPPLALYFSSSLSLSLRAFYLSSSSRPLLSVCSSFQAWQLRRGEHGEKSCPVPKLTNCSLQTQRVAVEIGSHAAKLDLLTLSPPLNIITSLSVPVWSLLHLSVAF